MPAPRSAPSRQQQKQQQQRPTLRAAFALGAIGLLMMTVPRIDAWVRAQFAERLAARAAETSGEEARLTVRRLADAGPETLGPLVRLACSPSGDAAVAARVAVLNRLAAWEVDVRVNGDERAFARQLQELSSALAASTPRFDAGGRAWAQRVALRVVAQSERLSGGDLLGVLANSDVVLSAPASSPSKSPAPRVANTKTPTSVPTPVPQQAAPFATAPADPDSATGDLHVVDQPPAPIAEVQPNVLADRRPTHTPAIAPREAPPSPLARPLPLPDASASVVDVPSPLQSRRLLRRYRQLSDRELSARLAASTGYDLLAIQQVLRERKLPKAARPTAAGVDASKLLFQRVGELPAAAARILLRELVADETETPETRLEALTLLATSGDPQLAAIARRRALEDADPRVADLATQILRDARK